MSTICFTIVLIDDNSSATELLQKLLSKWFRSCGMRVTFWIASTLDDACTTIDGLSRSDAVILIVDNRLPVCFNAESKLNFLNRRRGEIAARVLRGRGSKERESAKLELAECDRAIDGLTTENGVAHVLSHVGDPPDSWAVIELSGALSPTPVSTHERFFRILKPASFEELKILREIGVALQRRANGVDKLDRSLPSSTVSEDEHLGQQVTNRLVDELDHSNKPSVVRAQAGVKLGVELWLYIVCSAGLASLLAGYRSESPWLFAIGRTFVSAIVFFCVLVILLVTLVLVALVLSVGAVTRLWDRRGR
jgi:hypothetical protein